MTYLAIGISVLIAVMGALGVAGVISVAAGLMVPCLGLARIGKMVDWWSARPAFVFRAWSMVALAFGLYLVWALVPY